MTSSPRAAPHVVADRVGDEIARAAPVEVAQHLGVVGPAVANVRRRHPDDEHEQSADESAPESRRRGSPGVAGRASGEHQRPQRSEQRDRVSGYGDEVLLDLRRRDRMPRATPRRGEAAGEAVAASRHRLRRPAARERERRERVGEQEHEQDRQRGPNCEAGAQPGVTHEPVGGERQARGDRRERQRTDARAAATWRSQARPHPHRHRRPSAAECEAPAGAGTPYPGELGEHRPAPVATIRRQAADGEVEQAAAAAAAPFGRATRSTRRAAGTLAPARAARAPGRRGLPHVAPPQLGAALPAGCRHRIARVLGCVLAPAAGQAGEMPRWTARRGSLSPTPPRAARGRRAVRESGRASPTGARPRGPTRSRSATAPGRPRARGAGASVWDDGRRERFMR